MVNEMQEIGRGAFCLRVKQGREAPVDRAEVRMSA
jgi:hypothetical protein